MTAAAASEAASAADANGGAGWTTPQSMNESAGAGSSAGVNCGPKLAFGFG